MKIRTDRRTVHRFVVVELEEGEDATGNDAPFPPTLVHLRFWYGEKGTVDVVAGVFGMRAQGRNYAWDGKKYGQPGAPFPEYLQRIIEEVK